jgi:hypothetical protein
MIVAVQKNSARVTQNPLQAAKFKQFFTSGIEINPNEKMPRNVARSKELDYYTVDIKRGVPIRQDSLLVFATNKQGEVTAQVVAILVYTDAGRYPEGVNLDGKSFALSLSLCDYGYFFHITKNIILYFTL